MEQMKTLVRLQIVDKVIHDLTVEQEAIPRRLNEAEQEETELKDSLGQNQAELEEVREERRRIEKVLDEIKVRQRKSEQRLMGSKSQKEYRAASAEIEEARDSLRTAEDALIELMERQEALDKKVTQTSDRLKEVSSQARSQHKALRKRAAELTKELKKLTQKRSRFTGGVDKQLMSQYDFIRSRRQGVALAPVTKGTCGRCHMQLPPQQFNELLKGEKLMVCPSCRRIIYWAEAEELAGLQ